MIFSTERCEIVPVKREAFALFSNVDLMRSYTRGLPYTQKQFDQKFANWPSGYSIIHQDEVIGHLEVAGAPGFYEVAIMVAKVWQRSGIAREVLSAEIKRLNEKPIKMEIEDGNTTMVNLARILGFKKINEGIYQL